MSAHVLLNLSNNLQGKGIKCKACQAFYHFFAMTLINSIIQELNVRSFLSFDTKIIFKSHFLA